MTRLISLGGDGFILRTQLKTTWLSGLRLQNNMNEITWGEFEQVELRAGTIVEAREFPEAHKPAYQLEIDFGTEIGVLRSSAQITDYYTTQSLVGKQIIAVINFPDKQIGPFVSQCLTTGLYDKEHNVVLISPDRPVPNGSKLA